MNRRFGTPPEAGRVYTPRAGVYAIIEHKGGLLVTFQERPWPEFQLPGGGIDPGESPLPALYREVREETGFSIHSARRLGVFHRYTYMPDYDLWAQKICQIYHARAGLCLGPPREPGHWAILMPWEDAVEKLAVPGDRHFVRQLAQARR